MDTTRRRIRLFRYSQSEKSCATDTMPDYQSNEDESDLAMHTANYMSQYPKYPKWIPKERITIVSSNIQSQMLNLVLFSLL